MRKLIILLISSAFLITSCVEKKPENKETKKASKQEVKDVKTKKTAKATEKKAEKKEVKAEPALVFPEVVAEVNGIKINKTEITAQLDKMEKVYKQFGQKLTNKNKMKMAKDILNKIIDEKLIVAFAKDNKIEISQDELKKEVDRLKASFKKDEDFQKFMKKHDMTLEKIQEAFRRRLLRKKVIETQIIAKIKIDATKVKKYYDEHLKEFYREAEVKAKHILFKTARPLPKNATPEQKKDAEAKEKSAKEKAEKTLEKIKKDPKLNFGLLAKEVSEGPSAKKEGELGWFTKKRMVKPFSEAAFKVKKGEVSGLVKTSYGYHIIKVEDKKEAKQLSFEESKKNIEEKFKKKQIREDIKPFQKMLRTKYQVKLFLK